MLLDPIALAWSSWIGLAIGVIGTLVSVVGLTLTFQEAKRAKTAAEAAGADVARVVSLIRSRNRLATLASGVTQIDLLLERVERDALKAAPELLTTFRRAMIEARSGSSGILIQSSAEMTDVLNYLAQVDKLVWSDIEEKTKKAQMRDFLQRVRDILMELEVTAKSEEIA